MEKFSTTFISLLFIQPTGSRGPSDFNLLQTKNKLGNLNFSLLKSEDFVGGGQGKKKIKNVIIAKKVDIPLSQGKNKRKVENRILILVQSTLLKMINHGHSRGCVHVFDFNIQKFCVILLTFENKTWTQPGLCP